MRATRRTMSTRRQLLPIYDTPAYDQDPALSHDGCELYFASRRGGGDPRLYATRVE